MFSLAQQGEAMTCAKLLQSKTPSEFVIPLPRTEILNTEIRAAHSNLIANRRIAAMKNILTNISMNHEPPSGPLPAHIDTAQFIMEFRQDSSLLRTLFQSLKKRNPAQKEFIKFVRDFGILKDLIIMNDPDGARVMAKSLLNKYSDLNFESLIIQYRTSSKKELRIYFENLVERTRSIMDKVPHDQDATSLTNAKGAVTIDEVHEVRKSLRDVLRFMELQATSTIEWTATSPTTPRIDYSIQISYLKKINSSLGKICDQNAAKILAGDLTKESLIPFPHKLIAPINYFLQTYRFE